MRCREIMRLMDSGACAEKWEKPWSTHKQVWTSEGFFSRWR